ncbi:hypothetical protein [Methanothrix sp.]|uniref:hypothetical protein n=1 Tax=Methanothrix sp. TaxID=90426 RepID=UPI0023568C9C|nr:hypothetical protein [Methanothrix sp.]
MSIAGMPSRIMPSAKESIGQLSSTHPKKKSKIQKSFWLRSSWSEAMAINPDRL